MKITQEQLEWIVQEVVRRLRSSANSPNAARVATSLKLSERLITTETLRNQLDGVTSIEVCPKAIVTPAVIDLLRDQNITLTRRP